MTGTCYFEIYKRAVTEFKDPTLKKLLNNNSILFSETMYNYLENAISLFTTPYETVKRLALRTNPTNNTEQFTCDGTQNEFLLTNPPDVDLIDFYLFEYRVNGTKVVGEYNSNTNTVTLAETPENGAILTVETYYMGNFEKVLHDEEIYILSLFIVACWSEFISNDKLDIIRLLGDTDFKLTSNSSTTTAKTAWGVTNIERVNKRMSKYSWDCLYRGKYGS